MPHQRVISILAGVACIFVLSTLVWTNLRRAAANSRLQIAVEREALDEMERALSLNLTDAKFYYQRARILSKANRYAEAAADIETAVSLRPHDYFLWLWLGFTRYKANDLEGARKAYQESVRLAPNYAQPRWYLGRLLLKTNNADEAFAEIRKAIAVDNELLERGFAHAWSYYQGDVCKVVAALEPQDDMRTIAVAELLFARGRSRETLRCLPRIYKLPVEDRSSLVKKMLSAKDNASAVALWTYGREGLYEPGNLLDADFELNILDDESGLGWQTAHEGRSIDVLIDNNQPRNGLYSLHLRFTGASKQSNQIVFQKVWMVAPDAQYVLRFWVRMQDLVSGGAPLVSAFGADGALLAQTKLENSKNGEWKEIELNFRTRSFDDAVTLAIGRENCNPAPCPIFGNLWIDAFSLQRQ